MSAVSSSSQPLSDVEALLWSLDGHDPRLRSVITVVATVDRSPGVDHLRERSRHLVAHLPRLAQRIEPGLPGLGALGLAQPRWVPDPEFDPVWHIRVVGAPSPTGLDGVLRLIEPSAAEGFDRARSPWQMTLVEGIDADGGAALVIRLHHVCSDGIGALRLAAVLFDLSPGAPPPGPPDPDLAGGDPAAEGSLNGALQGSASVLRRRLPGLAARARSAVNDPEPVAQATVDLVRSVARLGSPNVRPLSPVMTGRSLASRLEVIDVDLDRAVAAGRGPGASGALRGPGASGALRGTVNDVFVAALLDGLRRYHLVHGQRPDALRIGIPINMRTADTGAEISNAFAPARITAPLQILDAQDRIAMVHRLILAERHQPAHEAIGPLAGVVHRVPGARAAMGAAMGAIDAMASNVPGPPVPLWLGQARVGALYAFGPRSGSGLNVTLLSHERIARLGLHLDRAATPDAEVLVDCLRDGFEATLT